MTEIPDLQNYVRRILTSSVYDVAVETPIEPMKQLGLRLGADVLLKREDLQPVFSFKIRGAHNKIAALGTTGRGCGVICASAGNHAQGVALSAARFGIRAVIVMPTTTPTIKIRSVRQLGGEVVLHGEGFDAAQAHALELAHRENLTFVHPFDDPDVIAGQGTIGMELLRQHAGPIGAIYVPVGGGGLAAGIAIYVKFLRPDIKIFGVEPAGALALAGLRRHGADYGRVLAGIQVPIASRGQFRQFLEGLGYDYWDETGNPAYQLFLQGNL